MVITRSEAAILATAIDLLVKLNDGDPQSNGSLGSLASQVPDWREHLETIRAHIEADALSVNLLARALQKAQESKITADDLALWVLRAGVDAAHGANLAGLESQLSFLAECHGDASLGKLVKKVAEQIEVAKTQ